MKRILCALLSMLLLFPLSPAVLAAEEAAGEAEIKEKTISTARQLAHFTRSCSRESYSRGVRFVLTTDIDLSESGVEIESAGYFVGEFDGGGHTIRGLAITAAGSRLGLFRQIGPEGSVHDLSVAGSVLPTGTQGEIGGLAGFNEGTIRSCSFAGELRGVQDVGGVAGKNTGTVTSCRFEGSVAGEHQVGGIAGTNAGVVFNCENEGDVNTVAITPSGERRFDLSSFSQEDFVDIGNIGGIAGENTGTVRFCRSSGGVGYSYTGYNVGGIAGKNSGFMDNCRFSGAVEGRRDVGGIVGQSVPYAAWELSEGKLQDLSRAITAMNGMLYAASQKLSGASESVRSSLQAMSGSSTQAMGAITTLLNAAAGQTAHYLEGVSVDPESGAITLPSANYAAADTSALTASLNSLFAQSAALSGAMDGVVGGTAEDLKGIFGQMSYIFNLVNALMGEVGQGDLISSRDLSLEEAYDHDEGAVARSENRGSVRGEANVGGVVGTVAFELSFDSEDTLGASNYLPTRAEQLLFAVVRGCENRGAVRSRGSCAGGIAGRMDIGAIVDCVSAASAASQSGDYVGGIAGVSQGSVARCWARSELEGGKYVGGIAGSGKALTDCRAWTHISRGAEYCGAVAGWAEGEVSGNLYADTRPDGVDGISRLAQAEPVSLEELLALEGAPEDFESVTVRFLVEDETVKTLTLPFGGEVKTLPEVENSGSAYWVWDPFDRAHIYADTDVTGRYLAPERTLSSSEDFPLFLVEGEFYEGQSLDVQPFAAELDGVEREGYTLSVDGFEGTLTVRMRSEDGARICIRSADGGFAGTDTEWDGRYLVFALKNGGSFLTVPESRRPDSLLYAALGGAALLALLLSARALRRRHKNRRRTAADSEADAPEETK